MTRSLPRTARGAVVLIALMTLAACTSDPGPIRTETPTPTTDVSSPPTSPSSTPSTSLAPLTDAELLALMPPEAAYTDIRGAIATAEFFLLQYPIALETGDLRVWDALSEPECIFCASVRDHVAENSARGEFETGNGVEFDRDTLVANYYDVDGFWYVTFEYTQEPSTLHRADGTTTTISPAESGSISVRLTQDVDAWRISDVGVEAS